MEEKAFSAAYLCKGCASGIYRDISHVHAMQAKENGAFISAAFTISQNIPEGKKERFVAHLSEQSKHWMKSTIRMESLP